jgi:hypothetical protein
MHLRLLVFLLLVGYSGSTIWATESKKCSQALMFAKLTAPYLPLLTSRTYYKYQLDSNSDAIWRVRESNAIIREDLIHQGKSATEVKTDLVASSLFGTDPLLVHTDFLLIARDPTNSLVYRAKRGRDGQYGEWQEGSPRHYHPSDDSQVQFQWMQKVNYQIPPNILKSRSYPKTFPDVMISTIKYPDNTMELSVYARDIGIVYLEQSNYKLGSVYERTWYEYDFIK